MEEGTVMFSTILAWIAFVGGSLVFLMLILDHFINKKENELRDLMLRLQGKRHTIWTTKLFVIIACWGAGGIYLFG